MKEKEQQEIKVKRGRKPKERPEEPKGQGNTTDITLSLPAHVIEALEKQATEQYRTKELQAAYLLSKELQNV